jgi:hypothetical protein
MLCLTPVYTFHGHNLLILANVAIEWLALLISIQSVPSLNLGPETDDFY